MDKLITNNALAAEKYFGLDVQFIEDSAVNVLIAARDYIHIGHKLLTHPLASSIPRADSPYKSVIISGIADKLDFESLKLIESAIAAYNIVETKINIHRTCSKTSFASEKAQRYNEFFASRNEVLEHVQQTIAEDFMIIDCDVIADAAKKSLT